MKPLVDPKTPTAFAQGNLALREKKYPKAMGFYLSAPFEHPILGGMIALNALLARRGRRRQQQAQAGAVRVAICAPELSDATSVRALELARLYQSFADVELIGTVFAKRGEAKLWSGVKREPVPVGSLPVAELSEFIDLATGFVLAHPCDAVHLCGQRASNVLLGLLYRLIWDSRVFVDIDDDQPAEGGKLKPVTIDSFLRKRASIPSLADIHGTDWSRLAFGLADQFDGISVGNEILCKEHGGSLISGADKYRGASALRLRKQTTTQVLRPGATTASALRLMELLPESRHVHLFGTLVDSQSARLSVAPPIGAARARQLFLDNRGADLPGSTQVLQAPAAQLSSLKADLPAELPWVPSSEFKTQTGAGPLIALGAEPIALGCDTELPGAFSALRAFCALHELDPATALTMEVTSSGIGGFDGFALLADAWYTNQNELRLRFEGPGGNAQDATVLRCYQLDVMAGQPRLLSEAMLSGTPSFADVPLLHALHPLLLTATTPAGMFKAAMLLPFPSLCRGGWHHGELSAIGTRPDSMANLVASSRDLLTQLLDGPASECGFAVRGLRIDLQGANGTEKIFASPVRSWLAGVFGIPTPAFTGGETHDDPRVREYLASTLEGSAGVPGTQSSRTALRAGGATLELPANCLPSLSALVCRKSQLAEGRTAQVGTYVVAHPVTGRPSSIVTLPPFGDSLLALQPRAVANNFPVLRANGAATSTAVDGATGFPLAICYREAHADRAAVLVSPVAPDASGPLLRRVLTGPERTDASISAILAVTSAEGALESLLESLARQTMAGQVDVVVGAGPSLGPGRRALDALLAQYFSGRARVVEAQDDREAVLLNAAAAEARGRRLLIADTATALHDRRTLETLYAMALDEQVATASCVLLREEAARKGTEIRFHTGGIFPSHVSLHAAPHVGFCEPYTMGPLPGATYPVVGNSFRLALVNAAAWKKLDGLDAGQHAPHRADLDFCLRSQFAGYTNLCTAAVTASCLKPGTRGEFVDSHSLHARSAQHWLELLSRVTLLREVGA